MSMESTDIIKQLSQKFLGDTTALIAPGTTIDTPYGTVNHTRGKASAIIISTPNGTVDFSEDIDGQAQLGTLTRTREPAHDDERDLPYQETVAFPRNEGDLEFMRGVVDSLREQRHDDVA